MITKTDIVGDLARSIAAKPVVASAMRSILSAEKRAELEKQLKANRKPDRLVRLDD